MKIPKDYDKLSLSEFTKLLYEIKLSESEKTALIFKYIIANPEL